MIAPCKVHAKVTTLTPPSDSLELRVFPTPSTTSFKIMPIYGVTMTDTKIVITNDQGKRLFVRSYDDGQVSWNAISQWEIKSAIYFVTLFDLKGNKLGTAKTIRFMN